MTRSLPAWGRLFLIGLVVSIVLHGAALDFWRGATVSEGATGLGFRPDALQARLLPESAGVLPEEPLRVPLDTAMSEKPIARPAQSARGAQRSAQRPSASIPDATFPVPVTLVPAAEAGLRPLSREEGLVAYRLALLAVLGAPPVRLAAPLQLELAVSRDGARVAIRESSGDAAQDQAWLAAIGQAALRAELPQVLAGQVFVLELELQP